MSIMRENVLARIAAGILTLCDWPGRTFSTPVAFLKVFWLTCFWSHSPGSDLASQAGKMLRLVGSLEARVG